MAPRAPRTASNDTEPSGAPTAQDRRALAQAGTHISLPIPNVITKLIP